MLSCLWVDCVLFLLTSPWFPLTYMRSDSKEQSVHTVPTGVFEMHTGNSYKQANNARIIHSHWKNSFVRK